VASGKIVFSIFDSNAPERVLSSVAVTPLVAEALRSAGYAPEEFNVARWPVGLRFHGEACLLVTRAALRVFAETNSPETVTLRMGVGDEIVDIAGLTIIDITPIVLTERSTRAEEGGNGLFRVVVADSRWKIYTLFAGADSYNVRGDDRSRIWDGDAASGYDAVIAGVGSGLLTSVEDAWPGGGSAPVDVSTACPAAELVDRLCTETGRVVAPTLLGTFKVQYWDKNPVQSWLEAYSGRIIAGGAEWRLGVIGDDYLDAVTLLQSKARRGCPGSVEVQFFDWSVQGRSDQTLQSYTASANAANSGLTSHRGITVVWDRFPYVGTNSVATQTRANEVGTAYYRRFLAGECDVVLSGCVAPPLGGGAQVVEWRASPDGFTTRVRASVDHPLLIQEDHRLRAIGVGGGGAVAGIGANDEAVAITTRDELMLGKIGAVTIAGGGNYPGNVTYTVVGPGDEPLGPFAANLTPRFRTFTGTSAIITPAAVGDPCVIAFGAYQSTPSIGRAIMLLATTESVTVQECAATPSPRPPPTINIDPILTDKRGKVRTDKYGCILLSKHATDEEVPAWNAVLTDKYGDVRADKFGRWLSSKYGPPAVQSLVDAVITDKTGDAMSDKFGNLRGNKYYA
jgi:hypothetical protein